MLVVDTAAGEASHLAWTGSDVEGKTFCGRPVHHVSRIWFELAGCLRCRKAAQRQNLARITDVDGRLIALADRDL